MTTRRHAPIAAAFLALTLSACASFVDGDAHEADARDNRPRTPGGIPYTKVCARTQCQTECQAEQAQECSECNSACWAVMTGGGSTSCVSTCAYACTPNCGYCSDDSPCVQSKYDFDYPWEPDATSTNTCTLAGACLRDPGWCANDSVTLDPEKAVQYYSCKQSHCDPLDFLGCLPPGGDLGSKARASGCWDGFPDDPLTHLNGWSQLLRPEVQETLAWCYSLGDCAEVHACEEGARYPYP
ncbi:MAG: hypothetical protein L6Q84_07715 [Polyangiaceae bacterium]|nr:hypothetical protein [Polyangiaceae bacterium]